MKEKDVSNKRVEEVRKLIAAALCDFIGTISDGKDPFIVGGQYPEERLLMEFRAWLQKRNFNVAGATKTTEKWINLCESHTFCGREGADKTPTPKPPTPKAKKPKPKPPKPKPKPPKPGTTAGGRDAEGKEPEGFLNGDDWKAEEDRKDNWQDEGEDWKKGSEDD